MSKKIETGRYRGRKDNSWKVERRHCRLEVGKNLFLNRTTVDWNNLQEQVVEQKNMKRFREMIIKSKGEGWCNKE